MKKIFLSFLAVIAMVGMVSAQRTWAYGLNMTQEGDNYTFVFKSTTAATAANLVFTDAAGEVAGKVALENVVAGENTKVLALADIPGEGTLNWAVELTGAAIEGVTEVTAAEDKYYYYLAQDVAANVNPESEHFGKMYVLETYKGAGDGASAHSKTQSQGIYVYDPMLNLENYAEGYLPSNVTLNTAAAGKLYRELHRMAINPVKDELAFVQSTAVKVWLAKLDDLNAEATNVAAETGIKASSLCYDENGTLYVLDPFAATATIYKQVDGEFVKFVERDNWGWTDDRNAMESDGRGGLWVVQNIADLATNGHSEDMLTHINAAGEVDFYVNKTSSAELQALMPAASNRGQIGYDAKNDVLALGGKGTVKLFNVTYTEDGPTLTLWQTVTLGGGNVDGLAFDYAGDLIAMSASVERFYKFALPTAENTCTTPAKKAQVIVKEAPAPVKYTVTVTATAEGEDIVTGGGEYAAGEEVTVTASEELDGWVFIGWTEDGEFVANDPEYTFVVDGDVELVAVYAMDLGENEVTDLVIDGGNRLLTGSIAGFPMGTMNLELALGEYDEEEGVYMLTEESKLYVGETNFTFVDGMAAVDMNTNSAMAIVVFELDEAYYYMTVNMSAATAEPVELVLTDAIVAINEETGTLTFNVPTEEEEGYYVELAGYTEPGVYEGPQVCLLETPEVVAFGTYAEVVVENGVYTLTCNGMASPMGQTFDLTVSGTVQQGPTGVENLNGAVAPVKMIENGQLIVIKDGVKFNAQGAVVK